MAERNHQSYAERQVGNHDNNAVFDRGFGIAAGKKVRSKGFNHNVRGQTDGVGDNCPGGHNRIFGGETSVAEKNINNRISQNNQGNRCWNGKQGAVFNRFVLAVTGCFDFSGFEVVGEYRQQGNADSCANHAERQLLNAVGIVEPGDGSGSDQRNNDGVNHHVNLIDAGSENAGSNTFEQGFDFSIMQQAADVELRFDADVNPPEKKVQPENFKQTGNGYAPGNAVGRGFAKGNKSKNGNNHCQIEDNRCCGRPGKFAERV